MSFNDVFLMLTVGLSSFGFAWVALGSLLPGPDSEERRTKYPLEEIKKEARGFGMGGAWLLTLFLMYMNGLDHLGVASLIGGVIAYGLVWNSAWQERKRDVSYARYKWKLNVPRLKLPPPWKLEFWFPWKGWRPLRRKVVQDDSAFLEQVAHGKGHPLATRALPQQAEVSSRTRYSTIVDATLGRIDRQPPALRKDIQTALRSASDDLKALFRMSVDHPLPSVRDQIKRVLDTVTTLIQELGHDPKDFPIIRRVFTFFLPNAVYILVKAERLTVTGQLSEVDEQRLQHTLSLISEALDLYLARMMRDEAFDLDARLTHLEHELAAEGLPPAEPTVAEALQGRERTPSAS